MNREPMDSLNGFLEAFCPKNRSPRFTALLRSEAGIRKFRHYLYNLPLNMERAQEFPARDRGDVLFEALVRAGAPESCTLISETRDPVETSLQEAMHYVATESFGTIISCIPGVLGYYQTDFPVMSYICRID